MTEPQAGLHWPLAFSVSGSNPRVDLSLRAAEDGTFVIDVMTETSLAQEPPIRLGAFRGKLRPDALERLAGVVAASLAGSSTAPPMLPPGSIARLVGAGGGAGVVAVGDEHDLATLDALVADAAIAALQDPVSAVVVEARPADAGHELVITGLGSEPFRLLLYTTETDGFWVRVWVNSPKGQIFLPFDAVVAVAQAGGLPDGIVELAAGRAVTVPLPPEAMPGSAGGFIFWRAGTGPERRIVAGSWVLPG